MAPANNSIITGKFRGLMGKQIVFRDWDGKTVAAKAPEARSGEPTEGQLVIQDSFLMATRYAKAIVRNADQSMAEAYAGALRPRQNVFSRAMEDFLSLPVVKRINPVNVSGQTTRFVCDASGNTMAVYEWVAIQRMAGIFFFSRSIPGSNKSAFAFK